MKILGIESSCDETAVAIYCQDDGLIAHKIYSQIELHQQYGGVVPELAARDHIRRTIPLVEACLAQAQLTAASITGVAYTAGPGLVGALMVGAAVARSLAYAWRVPAIGVHHMEAHLMAVMLEEERPAYPFVALLVSGGHTLLVEAKAFGQYTLLGESVDDAVGEAFDKTAKLLGLPYPGGPAIEALALSGVPGRFTLPRPMINRPGCDFSFSGLKTQTMTTFAQSSQDEQSRADIALAFQDAVVDTLRIKCERALAQTQASRLAVVGGVSANQALRSSLATHLAERGVQVYYPRLAYCTDNGAMVAYTGYLRHRQASESDFAVEVRARWPLTDLTPVT